MTQETEDINLIPKEDPATAELAQTQKLATDIQSTPEPFIHIGQRCDVGTVRERNEDTCFSTVIKSGGEDPLVPIALAIVADGMGGHHAGHEASRIVAHQMATNVIQRIGLPILNENGVTDPIQEILTSAVESANRSIFNPEPGKDGGTTLTCALIINSRLFLLHVGDSRAYLLDNGTLQQLTTDHSVVFRLQEAGHITAEEAAVHPQRNLLYKAITGHDLEYDTYTCTLPPNGKMVLCSDGLWGVVEDSFIKETITNNDLSVQEMCETLVDAAIENGSADNISVIIVDFHY